MRTSEISLILEKCTKILDMFGDMPLTDALDNLYYIAQKSLKEKSHKQVQEATTAKDISCTINDDLIAKMAQMNNEELSLFLQNTDIFKSKAELMLLTEKLSITTSKRHSIETLRHFIVTYFERGRMDSIFRHERSIT